MYVSLMNLDTERGNKKISLQTLEEDSNAFFEHYDKFLTLYTDSAKLIKALASSREERRKFLNFTQDIGIARQRLKLLHDDGRLLGCA